MSQSETAAVPVVEGTAPAKRSPGRPKGSKTSGKGPKIPVTKVRKPYGMKNAAMIERGGADENKDKQYRGFCGQCVKIRIPYNSGESRYPQLLTVSLGDLPKVHILVNRNVIVPTEIYGVLTDTTVEVPAPGNLGPDEGQRETETFVRIPVQYQGSATWEEYEAFLASERPKPIVPAKKF